METPLPPLGLRHLALWVADPRFEATVSFYTHVLGLKIVWQPDADNVYLSSGDDNLALHRAAPDRELGPGALDHLGFFARNPAEVQLWYEQVRSAADHGAEIMQPPTLHRDGASSFYFRYPAGHTVQILFIPAPES